MSNDDVCQTLWLSHKAIHNKNFTTTEDTVRLGNFKMTHERIEAHNKQIYRTYRCGHNQFSSWTLEEFYALQTLDHHQLSEHQRNTESQCLKIKIKKNSKVNRTFSWLERNAVTQAKNQGSCGSCWSFATTGALEGQQALKYDEIITLSEQQLVDCCNECNGCYGGLYSKAFDYIAKNGILTEEQYPYTAEEGVCQIKTDNHRLYVTEWGWAPRNDCIALQKCLESSGPLAVAFYASEYLMSYESGIYIPKPKENENRSNHAVLLTGFGVENDVGYWTLKNSWGLTWGENGYFNITMSDDLGVTDYPAWVQIR